MTYKVQIDEIIRDASPDETARIDEIAAETQMRLDAIETQSKNKQSARDKLKTLGLTLDEISALVGA